MKPQTPNHLTGIYDSAHRLQAIDSREKDCTINQDEQKKSNKRTEINRVITVDTWVAI